MTCLELEKRERAEYLMKPESFAFPPASGYIGDVAIETLGSIGTAASSAASLIRRALVLGFTDLFTAIEALDRIEQTPKHEFRIRIDRGFIFKQRGGRVPRPNRSLSKEPDGSYRFTVDVGRGFWAFLYLSLRPDDVAILRGDLWSLGCGREKRVITTGSVTFRSLDLRNEQRLIGRVEIDGDFDGSFEILNPFYGETSNPKR